MRRLEHLSGVEGMKVGIVVLEAPGDLGENTLDPVCPGGPRQIGREFAEAGLEPIQRGTKDLERSLLERKGSSDRHGVARHIIRGQKPARP